jgi:DNA-binding NarL/FixJ family response regulator
MEAGNGRQAMQQITQNADIDLMITDLVMPEQEGIETIRMVRKVRPDLKVIAMSGAAGGSYLGSATMLGASASLQKPFSTGELLRTVRDVLRDPARLR